MKTIKIDINKPDFRPIKVGLENDNKEVFISFLGFFAREGYAYNLKIVYGDKTIKDLPIDVSNPGFFITREYSSNPGIYMAYLIERKIDEDNYLNHEPFYFKIENVKYSSDLSELTFDHNLKFLYDDLLLLKNDLILKRDNGFFKGGKGDQGDQGNPGIVIPSKGMYAFEIIGNDLFIKYDGTEKPSVYIDKNGHLIFGEEN